MTHHYPEPAINAAPIELGTPLKLLLKFFTPAGTTIEFQLVKLENFYHCPLHTDYFQLNLQ
jgi:hypothetical protein